MAKVPAAVLGSGNIGTDLMYKIIGISDVLELVAVVGIDPDSDGLARAAKMNIPTTSDGVDGLLAMPQFDDIQVVFDATSAAAHAEHRAKLLPRGKKLVDLTPAAMGPYTVPDVSLDDHLEVSDVSMVTCGGQATIPIVAAVRRVTPVLYAEIVASIASRSAGPGTRANIDEFTQATGAAIETVGGADHGKAIIILNPAEPPLMMRDTIVCLCPQLDAAQKRSVSDSVAQAVDRVATYVPGYRLKRDVQFDDMSDALALRRLSPTAEATAATQVQVFIEVEGAAHYLPAYAGNLDIMTSAALRVGEQLAASASHGGGHDHE